MTGENYAEHPTGRTISRGEAAVKLEKIVETAVKAGMLVSVTSTNDYKIEPNDGTDSPIGWVAYEETPLQSRPDDPDTEYAVGDVAGVVLGGGFALNALVTGSTSVATTIVAGGLLESNGDGTLKPKSSGTAVARALESMTIAAAATATVKRIIVESLI